MHAVRWVHDVETAAVCELHMDRRVCLDTENPKRWTLPGVIC